MGDYRSKLRSAKNLVKEEQGLTNKVEDETDFMPPERPKTPPMRGIEFYFPPSPFGRKREKSYGDRFMTTRDHDEFQFNKTPSSSRQTDELNPSTMPANKVTEFLVNEVFSSTTDTPRRIQRVQSNATINTQIASNSLRVNNTVHRRSSYSDLIANCPRRPTTLRNPSSILSSSSTHHHSLNTSNCYSPNASRFQTLPYSEIGRQILTSPTLNSKLIKTVPIKTLDAPGLVSNFYYHLVDWGPNDCVAVALDSAVYLWNASTSEVTKLCDFVTQKVSLVKWSTAGSLLTVSVESGTMHLFDTAALQRIRSWSTHFTLGRTSYTAVAWKSNIMTTGCRTNIYHHDVRSPDDYFRQLIGHTDYVVGLKWNPEETMLASGGGDNRLLVWNSHESNILHNFVGHKAAVRAITWSPHKRGILASGGGTEDRTIKLWNTTLAKLTSSIDTGSQVCNLEWSKKTDHIVSSHGYAVAMNVKSNTIALWKADNMQKITSFEAHDSRVVYMSISHDGSTVVTGAGNDESLRFWDLFVNSPNINVQNSPLR